MAKLRHYTPDSQTPKKCDSEHIKPGLSPALMEMTKRDLEAFKSQSDEAFLIRAEMDKKLSSQKRKWCHPPINRLGVNSCYAEIINSK